LRIRSGAIDDIRPDEFRGYLDAFAQSRHLFGSATTIGSRRGGGATRHRRPRQRPGRGPGKDASTADLFAEHRCGRPDRDAPQDVAALPAALDRVVVARLSPTPGLRLGGDEILTGAVRRWWADAFVGSVL
jgi:hypothetical protein